MSTIGKRVADRDGDNIDWNENMYNEIGTNIKRIKLKHRNKFHFYYLLLFIPSYLCPLTRILYTYSNE